MSGLRSAIRLGRKLRLRYRSEAGEDTDRTVWPVMLGYAETTRLLIAWCELRADFRHFRTDRIVEAEVLEASTGLRRGDLRRRWQRWREQQGEQASVGARPTRKGRSGPAPP